MWMTLSSAALRRSPLVLVLGLALTASCGEEGAADSDGLAGSGGQGGSPGAGGNGEDEGGSGGIATGGKGGANTGGRAGSGGSGADGHAGAAGAGGSTTDGGSSGDGGSGGEPEPACSEIGANVAEHVAAMASQGWAALNQEAALLMHGCATAGAPPRDCLDEYPRANGTVYGAEWEADLPDAALHILHTTDYRSAFWTRSSPDGRFVAHGRSADDAAVIDLSGPSLIDASALYDPGFFPDGSGFAFQGSSAYFCAQSTLLGATTVTFTEPGCADLGAVALHQHLGASLGGGPYWSVTSQFDSDNPGTLARTTELLAPFPPNATVTFVPVTYTGIEFSAGAAITMALPGEGDAVISPSAELLVSRVSAGESEAQDGYRLYEVSATPSGNTYDIELSPVAHYCVNGGVPAFSYDERFIVLHDYVTDADASDLGFSGPEDDDFAAYRTEGAANIYLLDLTTGEASRITRMAPGQYALYPHFRSDGWIYFVVRTLGTAVEYIVASDAAL